MVQIKTSQLGERGTVRATSFGAIKFDENGIGEVESQEVADRLVAIDPSLSLVTQQPEQTETKTGSGNPSVDETLTDENPSTGSTEEGGSEQVEESEEVKALRAQLEEKNMGELRDILQEAGVAEEEYAGDEFKGKDNKGALIDFVISKVTKSE